MACETTGNGIKQKLMVIDGNSLANRAFYAIPMLSNSQGFITNAIYGFYNMLLKILDEEKPMYAAVAFDKGKIVFRHQDFSDYKAKRKPMPDELRPQFPVLKKLLQTMKIAIFELEGYEADDIIGTLVRWGETQNLENLVVTGDKDALQLISAQTKISLTKKGITELECYDKTALKEKYGLEPWQMIELKGLMGDASDNIPGIPGVGEKTALKLIQEYSEVENVLQHRNDFSGKKLGELLEQYAEQARLSRKLVVIDTNVPLKFSLDELLVEEPDYPALLELLQELEFKNILQTVKDKMARTAPELTVGAAPAVAGELADEPSILASYLLALQGGLALYCSAQKAGVAGYRLNTLAIKGEGQEPLHLDWQRDEELAAYLELLKSCLEKDSPQKTVHDGKTALQIFRSYGIELKGVVYDTLLMGYLLNPSRSQPELEHLTGEYLNIHSLPEEKTARSFSLVSALETLGPLLKKELENQETWKLYHDLELPLSLLLADMEKVGVSLDKEMLFSIGGGLDERIVALTAEIYGLAGEEFNINSPKQLGVILFDKLGLAKGKKTKTGYSTSADVLDALAAENKIVEQILNYRQLVKLKTTYIDGLQAIMDTAEGKVHTSLNQAVTATGRLSSTEPNLQNIPIRVEEGRRIRKAFLATPGHALISADYSQIELRVLAHIAQDEVLLEAFRNDQDIHTRTASEVFGVPMELVSREMRRAAKAVNFGIVYGISDFGLGQDLGISRAEARHYIDHYFEHYRGVKQYIDDIVASAREKGYVTTLLNRRRYLPDILSRNFNLRSFAERTAMNTPIQGSAADIIKLAMLKMQEVLANEPDLGDMILQVHDELIFDVPHTRIEEMGRIVNMVMSQAYPLAVPLKVDIKTGPNWYDMEPIIII